MRVVADLSRCESNAVCMAVAPEVFEVRDDDRLYLVTNQPPPGPIAGRAREAVRRCPKQALSIVED